MADTAPIEETFGLIAVDEFGGKVRLYTEAELLELARAEASYCRANGKGDEYIEANIRSWWGPAALRLYLRAGTRPHKKTPGPG